jgi:hypothetical protein
MSDHASAPLPLRALVWRIVTIIVVIGMALLCWNQIARNLGGVLYARRTWEAVGPGTDGNYYLGAAFTITGTPLLIAIGNVLLASAFGIGARLTRDTMGLV